MGWLRDLFTAILNMSVTGGITILAILALRILLKKAPRKYLYALWLAAAFRLLCPWAPYSGISLFNLEIFRSADMKGQTLTWYVPEGNGQAAEITPDVQRVSESREENSVYPEDQRESTEKIGKKSWENAGASADTERENSGGQEVQEYIRENLWLSGLSLIWISGMFLFLFYHFFCWIKIKKSVRQAINTEKNVYEWDGGDTPFVMGIFRPRIYLPFRLTQPQREMVLLHERYHIHRGDHVVKILAVFLLAVYWFHPLVWAAFYFMTEDMEMSCDEAVMKKLGDRGKADYGECLLSFSVEKRKLPGTLAFGESSVGKRIKNVLRFQKKKPWAGIVAAVICIAAGAVLVTNGLGGTPGLRYSGFLRYGTNEGNFSSQSQGMDYILDPGTKTVAFYRELWREGELEDYELLDVRRVGDREDEFPDTGRFTAEWTYDFSKENRWEMSSDLYFEGESGGERKKISDTYQMTGNSYSCGGLGANFRVEEYEKFQELLPEQDLVLAAYHVGYGNNDGSGGLYSFSCEDLDDPGNGFYWNRKKEKANSQELLYRMAVSEKSVAELEEECGISLETRKIFASKISYIGDAPGVMELLNVLHMEELGDFSIELQTDAEPYTLTLIFQDEPEDMARWNLKMEKKAILLLALIENAGQIEWNHPAENGKETYRWKMDLETAEDRTEIYGIKENMKNAEDFQSLWEKTGAMENNGKWLEPQWTEDGWDTGDGSVYPYRYYTAGMLPNAEYAGIVEILAEEDGLTYEEAMEPMLSSTWNPGSPEVRILWLG